MSTGEDSLTKTERLNFIIRSAFSFLCSLYIKSTLDETITQFLEDKQNKLLFQYIVTFIVIAITLVIW